MISIVEELRTNRESGAKRLEAEYKAGLMTLARRFYADEGDAEELVNRTLAEVEVSVSTPVDRSYEDTVSACLTSSNRPSAFKIRDAPLPASATTWRRQASESPVSCVRVTATEFVDEPIATLVSTRQTTFDESVSHVASVRLTTPSTSVPTCSPVSVQTVQSPGRSTTDVVTAPRSS